MWFIGAVVEALFIAYCLSAKRVPLSFPAFLYVAKSKVPQLYWGLIAWCCLGEVFFVVMAVKGLVLPKG